MQANAAADIAGSADRVKTALDKIDAAAQAKARQAAENLRNKTRGGANVAADAVAKAQAELDAATKKAAQAREAVRKRDEDNANKAKGAETPDLTGLKSDTMATFSAAHLAAAGQGASMQDVAGNTRKCAANWPSQTSRSRASITRSRVGECFGAETMLEFSFDAGRTAEYIRCLRRNQPVAPPPGGWGPLDCLLLAGVAQRL